MPAKFYTVGPGSLTFGETGDDLDLSCQVSSAEISWDSDSEDDTYVLCGDVIPGESKFTATLTATILQDITTGGAIDYSWKHKGEQVKFVYVPNKKETATITGMCVIQPLGVGGEVKARPTTDLEWPCVGEPELTYPTAKVGK